MTYKLAYISYDNEDQILKDRSTIILNDFFGLDSYDLKDEFSDVVFIASGGSEQVAVKLTENKNNIILLCHRESNSYAATMEIAAYLNAKNKRVSIIDVFAENAFIEFKEIQNINRAIDSLTNEKAAILGEVSDWLIHSDIEAKTIKDILGIELLRLPWSQLDDYRKEDSSEEFMTYFPEQKEMHLKDTAKVYTLLEKIIAQEELSAISVECFSMVRRDQVTACLPLAVLNTKNTVAACEGDVCSMIGKMIIRSLTNQIPWQANVAEIKNESILFAHCTAPLHHLSSFDVTTHYESNCGTAIQGEFYKGNIGVFRIDKELKNYMILEGEIIDTPNHSFACRTQIEFQTTKEQTSLLKNKSLGNHQLIFPAEHISSLKKMMNLLNINRIQ